MIAGLALERASQLRRRIRIMTERRLPRGRLLVAGFIGLCVACVAVAAGLQAPVVTIPDSSTPRTTALSEQATTTASATGATLFDLDKTASVHGTVRRFQWRLPQGRLVLSVPDAHGNRSVWSFDRISSEQLHRRYQWTDQSLRQGDTVTVDFHPLHDARHHGGLLIRVVKADGRTLSAGTPADFASLNVPEYTAVTTNLQNAFGTKTLWKAVVTAQSRVFLDDSPLQDDELQDARPSQSRICFIDDSTSANHCTYFRDLFGSPRTYQTFTDFSVIPLVSRSPNTMGLVLRATGLYTNAAVHETAIWVYDARKDEFHVTAALESGELRVASEGPLDGHLITADWDSAKGEARWDAHRRDITVYRLDSNDGAPAYHQVLKYTTATKYGAEDTNTINSEMPAILARLDIPTEASADVAAPPKLLWEPIPVPTPPASHSKSDASRTNLLVTGIQLGGVHVALDETTLKAVQQQLGGIMDGKGDAGNSLSWICLDAGKQATPSVVWLESDELYHDIVAGFQWRYVPQGSAPDARCQPLPSATTIGLPIAVRLGDTVAQVRTALGAPTSQSKDVLFYAAAQPAVRQNGVWTTVNTVAIQVRDGTVRAIEAWMSTTD